MITESDIPMTLEDRYYFLLAILQAMIQDKVVKPDANVLQLIKVAVSSNPEGDAESEILKQIEEYQAKTTFRPFWEEDCPTVPEDRREWLRQAKWDQIGNLQMFLMPFNALA